MRRWASIWIGLLVAGLAGGASAGGERVPRAAPGAPPLPEALRERLAAELARRGPDYRPRTRHLRADGSPRFTNRLLLEASPYLQQHAHNPVDWYPWGDEAFEAARRLDRPVLVSIGYSTCHWCHVMEEESFENPETARILNESFIAVKVDREARPDVDAIYMGALNAMGEPGGWPLNVFVTPDREPFFGGTYFPPEDVGGRRGLPGVLHVIAGLWSTERGEVESTAEQLTRAVRGGLEGAVATSTQIPGREVFDDAMAAVREHVDRDWGGLGTRQKFPASFPARALLRYHRRTGDPEALDLTLLTLERMAAGGLRDHVGGGFHRYSTEPRWLVPHFEKMLYDNAQLAVVYLEAWQVTERAEFAEVAREVLDYVRREMTSPEGAFYSATDADSAAPDGRMEEGRYFTWTPAEIEAAVGPEDAKAVIAFYGVSERGDLEGRSILHRWRPAEEVARELGVKPEALARTIARARTALYEARRRRPAPLRDEKILTAWNGLMISAFARAGFALAEPAYVESARRAADFVLEHMRGDDGRLVRVYQDGRATGPAFLEDYAFLIAALLDLYEASPDPRWIREAVALQAVLDAHYADELGGGYFRTADDHESLLAREKPSRDDALPSGNSVEALNLLRLHEYTLDDSHLERVSLLLSAFHDDLTQRPLSLPEMLVALDYHLDSIKEVVVVRPDGEDGGRMLAPVRPAFVPNRILSVVTEGADLEAHAKWVPLVRGKRARAGRVTAYVCADRVCRMPTEDPEVFARLVTEVKPLDEGVP